MSTRFTALVVRKTTAGAFEQNLEEREICDLPSNDVLVRVHYSSLNYKDCLSYSGNLGVTRRFPHTPGIDAAGVVVSSKSGEFKEGDQVLVVSHALGMSVPGGFGQYITSPADWLLPLPDGLTLKESMIYGTAGYTAALAVQALTENGIEAGRGKIVVTGATGGVGVLSIAILATLGFDVTASTGKTGSRDLLEIAGAREIISRDDVRDLTDRGQLTPRWIAAVDTVGGATLSTIIRSLEHEGMAIATGLVESQKLETSLLPFILRGVKLTGINAEGKERLARKYIWQKMASDWKPACLDEICNEIPLELLKTSIDSMLEGSHQGRTIIQLG